MKLHGNAFKDLTGKRIGRLTVIRDSGKDKKGNYKWECKCDCGNTTTVTSSHLITGHTRSCGCLLIKHHMWNTRQYQIWRAMLDRCYNPRIKSYKDYGGRGISVCEKWQTFEGFWDDIASGYSKDLTIDRINVNGNYEPNNCRWATRRTQGNNRRNNVLLTHEGVTDTITNWARKLGVNANTLISRYHRGYSVEEILTLPVRRKREVAI